MPITQNDINKAAQDLASRTKHILNVNTSLQYTGFRFLSARMKLNQIYAHFANSIYLSDGSLDSLAAATQYEGFRMPLTLKVAIAEYQAQRDVLLHLLKYPDSNVDTRMQPYLVSRASLRKLQEQGRVDPAYFFKSGLEEIIEETNRPVQKISGNMKIGLQDLHLPVKEHADSNPSTAAEPSGYQALEEEPHPSPYYQASRLSSLSAPTRSSDENAPLSSKTRRSMLP